MTYKTQEQRKLEDSPEYFFTHFRDLPENYDESLDDFLSWLNDDCTDETVDTDFCLKVEKLIQTFMKYNIEKISKGEQSILEKWNTSVRSY